MEVCGVVKFCGGIVLQNAHPGCGTSTWEPIDDNDGVRLQEPWKRLRGLDALLQRLGRTLLCSPVANLTLLPLTMGLRKTRSGSESRGADCAELAPDSAPTDWGVRNTFATYRHRAFFRDKGASQGKRWRCKRGRQEPLLRH